MKESSRGVVVPGAWRTLAWTGLAVVSNDVVHAMRPPKFAEALFRFDDESKGVSIHVHY